MAVDVLERLVGIKNIKKKEIKNDLVKEHFFMFC